jgi:hypothetical protein
MAFNERFIRSHPPTQAVGRSIKWYHLNVEDRAIEPEVIEAAHAALPPLLPTAADATPPATFVILHRGRGAAVYLVVYSWVWDNVLECHSASAGVPILGSSEAEPLRFVEITKPWIGCVWELAPFEHERAAWVRHMLAPERADLAGYLADTYRDGPAGR